MGQITKSSITPEPSQGLDVCKNITAAILAGGLGKRLRPALKGTPKVLAPVGERPFITFVLDQLAGAGIRNVVLLTGYRAAQVRRSLGSAYAGMELSYSVEPVPLGTGGALRQALTKLATETVLLLNGDSYCEVDLSCLIAEHQRRRAGLTLTVCHVADAGRYGGVQAAAHGLVTHFGEKQSTGPGWINAGVSVLRRSLVSAIAAGQPCSLERDMLPGWVGARQVYAYKAQGGFLDIGTPTSYAGAGAFFDGAEHYHGQGFARQ